MNVNGKNVSLGIDFTDPAMKAFFDPIVTNAIKASGLSEKANDMLEENYRNDYDDDQYLRKSGMGARMAAHDL